MCVCVCVCVFIQKLLIPKYLRIFFAHNSLFLLLSHINKKYQVRLCEGSYFLLK